ncbi:MAG: hypothetical protein M1825_006078 [Sarcosagium campestre]|nr:MAG: hypothetical protein M1825_006078 [Sarcosagium campestre]
MSIPRRLVPLAAIGILLFVVFIFTGLFDGVYDRPASPSATSMTEPNTTHMEISRSIRSSWMTKTPLGDTRQERHSSRSAFKAGTVKPTGSNYTRVLVLASTKDEDTSWVAKELPELDKAIYVVNDPKASLRPPLNKGHELMVYLTFIIDNYDQLPELVLFMHAHRWAYHNNEVLGADAVKMIKALSSERVIREGYMNLRCVWDPGCPAHLRPLAKELDFHHMQPVMADQWPHLFPHRDIPETLAQPCCSQFAVSRERLRSISLREFISYRDWLLRTPVTDYYSGRLWEYLWQYVFTGQGVHCPEAHVCYCDGFGYCFGGHDQYEEVDRLFIKRGNIQHQIEEWEKLAFAALDGGLASKAKAPEPGKNIYLQGQRDALNREIDARVATAKGRGKHPKNRAMEAGRKWKDGDGF